MANDMYFIDEQEVTVEIDRNKVRHPEYCWDLPVLSPVQVNKYWGKSVEEIRKEYGDGEAQAVYTMACNGFDQTKMPIKQDLETKTFIRIRLEMEHKDDFQIVWRVFLVANEYTEAGADLLLAGGSYQESSYIKAQELVTNTLRHAA